MDSNVNFVILTRTIEVAHMVHGWVVTDLLFHPEERRMVELPGDHVNSFEWV